MKPTPEQQRIIEHPLEPVRVTAGAGTGKTATMAWRLAHLVETEGLAPEEALGITFTNKAAEELASRLRAHLPEHAAEGREVQVLTYHAFAGSLLREFGPHLGFARDLRVVTPGYARQLLRDALGEEDRPNLALTQPGRVVDELSRLASTLGDHLRTPEELISLTDDEVGAARDELAAALVAYQRRKNDLGVIDYDDMVTRAHELATTEGIAQQVRGRYRAVLLDEYQDTNPAQRELLRAVFGDGFPVTAVGDSDQTIYEWRGASPANFADFPIHFPTEGGEPSPTLTLSMNWRSSHAVLEVANDVRQAIRHRSDIERLMPRHDAPPGRVRTHWLHTSLDEADWIADEARRLHDEDGHAWNDIAVLFRKHAPMAVIRDALAARGIPVEVASLGGLLDVPEVADLHAWLRCLGRPHDDVALVRLLMGAHSRLGLGDLAPLAHWARRRSRSADPDGELGWTLLEALDHLGEVEGLDPEAERRIERFIAVYRGLLTAAQGVSLVELCRLILDRTDAWLEVEALDGPARLSARLNLYRFLDLAEGWSPIEGAPSLPAFLEHLDLLADETSDNSLDTANVSGEDAVLLVTVHRAKGLEWPVVFLPALGKGTFPSNVITYADPFVRPEVVPYALRLDGEHLPHLGDDLNHRKAELKAAHDDQEWRTAYVAVTRARDELIATGAHWYTLGRAKEPSPLFEVIDARAEPVPGRVDDAGKAPDSLHRLSDGQAAPDPTFDGGWRQALIDAVADPSLPAAWATEAGVTEAFDETVGQLRLSLHDLPTAFTEPAPGPSPRLAVTGAVTFASCPQRYHWAHVDRLPRRPAPAARRGATVHRRIERHLRGDLTFDDVATEPSSHQYDGSPLPPSAYDVFLASRFADMDPILVEAPFSLRVGEARVDGRIDAVFEPEPGLWEVVDFKSGRANDDPAQRIQLEAYAIAVSEAGFLGAAPERIRVTFAYLGEGTVVEVTEDVDAAWLATARARLEGIVEAASAGERHPTPSDACRWCDFSRFCEAGTAWLDAHGRR